MDCLIKAKGNISRCELTGFEKLEQNIDNPEWNRFRAVILLVCLLTQVCGNTMCLSIWSYERYGGDPQKRTILNQLTGQLVMHCVFANLTSLATFMFRLAFGPISTFWVEATYFISNAHVGITSVFAFSEIAILKFLSIFIWKRLPPINEEFLGLFFRIANHSVGLMFALFGRKGSSKNHELYYILTGLPLMSDQNEPMFRYSVIMLIAILNKANYSVIQVLQSTPDDNDWNTRFLWASTLVSKAQVVAEQEKCCYGYANSSTGSVKSCQQPSSYFWLQQYRGQL